jgi:hypothetical protein
MGDGRRAILQGALREVSPVPGLSVTYGCYPPFFLPSQAFLACAFPSATAAMDDGDGNGKADTSVSTENLVVPASEDEEADQE